MHDDNSITVRLATDARVTVPKVLLNLGLKFLDFNSVKRCLVLDLDSRYDLILGMPRAMDRLEIQNIRRNAHCF